MSSENSEKEGSKDELHGSADYAMTSQCKNCELCKDVNHITAFLRLALDINSHCRKETGLRISYKKFSTIFSFVSKKSADIYNF